MLPQMNTRKVSKGIGTQSQSTTRGTDRGSDRLGDREG